MTTPEIDAERTEAKARRGGSVPLTTKYSIPVPIDEGQRDAMLRIDKVRVFGICRVQPEIDCLNGLLLDFRCSHISLASFQTNE